jgi:hypothetical protein
MILASDYSDFSMVFDQKPPIIVGSWSRNTMLKSDNCFCTIPAGNGKKRSLIQERIPAFITRQFFEFCSYISAIGRSPMQVNGFLILNIILKSWILKKRVFTALFYKLFFMVVICIKHTEWTKVDSIKNWNWLISKTKYFYFSSLNKTWQIESNQK